jgi:hypothetical protein
MGSGSSTVSATVGILTQQQRIAEFTRQFSPTFWAIGD